MSTPNPTPTWTRDQLEQTLNTAIAVELFTIPVYLSAANSIKKENRTDKVVPVTIKGDTSGSTKQEYFSAYDVIMSVAVQEMYHLTLACNLCNAMGFRPNIQAPDLDNPPSCLSPIIGMPVRGNLSTLIDTMVAIEKPDEQYVEPPSDPLQPAGPTGYQDSYKSIGDLYHALAYGVNQLWSYNSDNDAYQKGNFEGKYQNINQIIKTKEDALIAMACIVEEGEGVGLGKFMSDDYIPTQAGAMFHDLDEVDHWHRFLDIQSYLQSNPEGIPQYSGTAPSPSDKDNPAIKNLQQNYSILIQQMHEDFASTKPLDLRGMQQTGKYSTEVWQAGFIPQWNTIANPTPWPPVLNPHSCQGLNECRGQGYNNTGTGPGDGECATAADHGCQYTNNCKNQGGCGYPGKSAQTGGHAVYAPRANSCHNLGGCMSPISPFQYYQETETNNPHKGKFVWEVARNLFEESMRERQPDKPILPCGPVSKRRLAVTPNSTKPKS